MGVVLDLRQLPVSRIHLRAATTIRAAGEAPPGHLAAEFGAAPTPPPVSAVPFVSIGGADFKAQLSGNGWRDGIHDRPPDCAADAPPVRKQKADRPRISPAIRSARVLRHAPSCYKNAISAKLSATFPSVFWLFSV
jgi:hypothetical protein